MRRLTRYILLTAVAALLTMMGSSCLRQNYLMFEDGDFDGMEFSDYDQLQNAELDIDDLDR